MPKRLLVIDGADKGQAFLLPPAGTLLIGNSRKQTDICLHDLLVAQVHCQVTTEGERVTVSDRVKPNGILVNGVKVPQWELQLGEVFRVGNSYLRLEEAEAEAAQAADAKGPAAPAAPEEPGKLPHVPLERLAELAGHTLAHFKIGALLARGHCGGVFAARDLQTDQAVALKVLAPTFPAAPEEMQCFIRAMKPRLALHHPALVPLRGVGKSGPYVWVAMELVGGESVAQVIQNQRAARKIPWRPALRVALHLGRALDHLRRNHLVHGNITPANILLTDEGQQARLNDQGMWAGLAGSALQKQAMERKLRAELPYMSPEHLDPDATVDDLSDQYCLGAVIYALLTGRPPFEGGPPEDLQQRIRTALPSRPKEWQRALPDEFQAVVLRMLAKHPEERYPGPGPLLADLEALTAQHGKDG